MKISTFLALAALLGLAQPGTAAAQEGGGDARRENQDTERTQEAREKKKQKDAERTRDAREQAEKKEAEEAEQDADGAKKRREGAREGVQDQREGAETRRAAGDGVQVRDLSDRATVRGAENRRGVGVQNEADRAKEARQDAADKQAERIQNARGDAQEKRNERAKDVRDAGQNDRIENARGDAQEKRNERAKDVRDAGQNDRIENARGDANARRADRVENARAAEVRAQKTKMVQDMTRRVREHKVRLAEIGRLESIFQGRGDEKKLERVQALKKKENGAYAKVMERYETLLGKDDFKNVRGRLRADGTSPAPAPGPAPVRGGR